MDGLQYEMKCSLANAKQGMHDSGPSGDGKAIFGKDEDALKYLNKFS